jgi:predicted DNA-binding protein (MmcQ/YjbR family)
MPKKTDEQALAWMRKVCLALPDTTEGIHYGEISFKVGKNMFASCGDKRGPRMIVFRVDPKKTEALLKKDERFKRYPYEKTALFIPASEVDDWEQMRELVEESYRREASTPPTKRARK